MRLKLIWLCSFFLSIILAVGIYSLIQTFNIVHYLNDISKVQLPAVRKISIVDMHHDGLTGIVYKAMYAGENGDKTSLLEIQKSHSETGTEMQRLMKEIGELDLRAETKKAIGESLPAISNYIEQAKIIIDYNLEGKRAEAVVKLSDFNSAFKALEEKLDTLGSAIEADAEKGQKQAADIESTSKKTNIIVLLSSFIIGALSSWFIVRGLMKNIALTVESLSNSAHDVQNSAQKMNGLSRKLAVTVENQASSITESVTAMDEISAMIKNNANSAVNASDLSLKTKQSAESGKQTVDKMMKGMQEISESYDQIQLSVSQNSEDILKIIEVISQIAKKTEVINDIVFQTKLLSFNASVEAARAGEAGKGFAVVAEEVGNLAQMSGKASFDIAKMLAESQEQVKILADKTTLNINQIVGMGRAKVESGTTVASECLSELEKISQAIDELDFSVKEISQAVKEQSIGVDEVNIALKRLDEAMIESNHMSERAKNTSEGLSAQAHSLRAAIQGLRKILGSKKSYETPPIEKFTEGLAEA